MSPTLVYTMGACTSTHAAYVLMLQTSNNCRLCAFKFTISSTVPNQRLEEEDRTADSTTAARVLARQLNMY
jgi:hypothetical protein